MNGFRVTIVFKTDILASVSNLVFEVDNEEQARSLRYSSDSSVENIRYRDNNNGKVVWVQK